MEVDVRFRRGGGGMGRVGGPGRAACLGGWGVARGGSRGASVARPAPAQQKRARARRGGGWSVEREESSGRPRDTDQRSLALVKDVGIDESWVLIDHNNEETLPLVKKTGCWAGHSIYPDTKMTEERMVDLLKKYGTERMVVNSAADWGKSDPLKVPKTA